MHEVWIGIDVAKDWLDVASSDEERVERFTNDAAGVAALVAELVPRDPTWWCWKPPAGMSG